MALPVPRTPAGSSPTKPSMSEMHPGKANGPKAPPSSALRLGFADISSVQLESPTTAKIHRHDASALLAATPQGTPSKLRSPLAGLSPFTFRFSSKNGKTPSKMTPAKTFGNAEPAPAAGVTASPIKIISELDENLSDEARRMMEQVRQDARQIHADLVAQREREEAMADADGAAAPGGRKIAKPKSRFSAAHTAEFSKMDSIANHPSAFRASRFTPVRSTGTGPAPTSAISSQSRGLKRTQSKANLDETPSYALAKGAGTPAASKATKKPHDSTPQTARRGNLLFQTSTEELPLSAAKRIKQHLGDDASSSRPASRDASSLPRPALPGTSTSGLTRSHTTASLLTPTKASLARSASIKTSGTSHLPHKTPSRTPSKTSLNGARNTDQPKQPLSALKKSATTSSLQAVSNATQPAQTAAPKPSLFHVGIRKPGSATAALANTSATRDAASLPMASAILAFSKTPAPPRPEAKVLPRFPATTPRRKLSKRVAFTPGTQRAVLSEHSPSLFRSGLPRSALKSTEGTGMDLTQSPSVRRRFGATVFYPDLSSHELLGGVAASPNGKAGPTEFTAGSSKLAPLASVPGTFTFRSDKTISFGQTSPTGFGSSPGQATLRQVPSSTSDVPKIPGSFPSGSYGRGMFTGLVPTDGPNKENTRPVAVNIIPHGITNKKRHRVSEAEEEAEQEAAERAAKKRKNEPVPEGEALLAPRLVGKATASRTVFGSVRSTPQKPMPAKQATSSGAAHGAKTPGSVAKKRPVLSLSRLNSLARPKLRK